LEKDNPFRLFVVENGSNKWSAKFILCPAREQLKREMGDDNGPAMRTWTCWSDLP